jgi:hypothetical protein
MPCKRSSPPSIDWKALFHRLHTRGVELERNTATYARWDYLRDRKCIAEMFAFLQRWLNQIEEFYHSGMFDHVTRNMVKNLTILENTFIHVEKFYTEFAIDANSVKETTKRTTTIIFNDLVIPPPSRIYRFFLSTLRKNNITVTEHHKRIALNYAKSIISLVVKEYELWDGYARETVNKIFQYLYNTGTLPILEQPYNYFVLLLTNNNVHVPPNYKELAKGRIEHALLHVEQLYANWWEENIYEYFNGVFDDSLIFIEDNPPYTYGFHKPLRDVFEKLAELKISVKLPPGQQLEPPTKEDKCDTYNRGVLTFQNWIVKDGFVHLEYLTQLIGEAFRHRNGCNHFIEGVMDAFHYYFDRLVVHEDSFTFYKSFYGQYTRQEFNWQRVKPVFFSDDEFLGEYAPQEDYPRHQPKARKKVSHCVECD